MANAVVWITQKNSGQSNDNVLSLVVASYIAIVAVLGMFMVVDDPYLLVLTLISL